MVKKVNSSLGWAESRYSYGKCKKVCYTKGKDFDSMFTGKVLGVCGAILEMNQRAADRERILTSKT